MKSVVLFIKIQSFENRENNNVSKVEKEIISLTY